MQIPDIARPGRASMIIFLAGLLLVACGQYGDLYLPPEATPADEAGREQPASEPEAEPEPDPNKDEDT